MATKAAETMEKLFQQMLEESALREEEERYAADIREAGEHREKDLKIVEENMMRCCFAYNWLIKT